MSLKKSKIMLADGFPTLPDFEQMETGEATKDDVYATQGIIAHVQKTLKADSAYSAGDQFIYDGKLYTATGSIAKDANIVLTGAGANATLASVIQTQINTLANKMPDANWSDISSACSFKTDFESANPSLRVKNGITFLKFIFKITTGSAISASRKYIADVDNSVVPFPDPYGTGKPAFVCDAFLLISGSSGIQRIGRLEFVKWSTSNTRVYCNFDTALPDTETKTQTIYSEIIPIV